MKLPFFIARRYLFSKKSHNAVNVISTISVCGIVVATAAMVCVLSVFNGLSGIVVKSFNAFDPDLKIEVKKGKTFNYQTEPFQRALRLDGINMISESLEENALFKYDERQVPVLVKGVSEEFNLMSDMDTVMIDGRFMLRENVVDYSTLGLGLAMTLGVRVGYVQPIEIYAPKRNERVNLANPASAFTLGTVQIGGIFSLNQPEYDDQMAIVPIELARELFLYNDSTVTSIDISVREGASVNSLKKEIQQILGNDFAVKNRFEQQADSYRMLLMEKWVTFLILAFILLIAVFNVVGSLSMLIVEKQSDIKSLQNMGASNRLISQIFLFEGWLIAFIGVIIGLTVGIILSLLQQYFGFIRLGNNPGAYAVEAYPVIVQPMDIVIVFVVVSVVSLLTVLYPINNLKKKLNRA